MLYICQPSGRHDGADPGLAARSDLLAQGRVPGRGVVDGLGQELFGLDDEAGQSVQPDGGIAEPVRGVRSWSIASSRA